MQKKTLILCIFIALKFLIQYSLIDPVYDLHRDEYLHLDQSNHLAWGFLSVPPVTSWVSYLIKILGNTVFWIKFFPALFGALTTLLVWKTIELLKGDLFALIFGASCITFSVLFRINLLYQPNSLDILCWTTFYYLLLRYLSSFQSQWLYYMAVTLAIGFLNKYNIVILIAGMLPAILFTPQRKIFRCRHLYLALALFLLLISPNLIWQYQNNFPVIRHLSELSELQLVHVSRWSFIRSQLLFFPGTFVVILTGLFALLRYAPYKIYRPFFWSLFFTLGIFLFFRAKDYYALGIYPVYFALGAVYIATFLENKKRIILKPVFIVLSFLLFIPVYQVAFPNKRPEYIISHKAKYSKLGLLRWEDGRDHHLPQDFADMLGWGELAAKVDNAFKGMPPQGNTLVLCDNYGQAGAINYYSQLGIRAVAFSADYVNWMDLSREYKNLIRVKDRMDRDDELKNTSVFFEKSFISDSITNANAREYGTTIFCFVGARININQRIRKELNR
ncbi:MAG TPA: glycosyltransferase family 39 protein [Agriterribacter sp.]|nr:glycosyltransferase family 39 protein [Agriterribacter sp.]